METARNLKADIAKTGKSSLNLVSAMPQDAVLDIFSGRNPIPGMQAYFKTAFMDVLTTPFRMSSSLLGGAARATGRAALGVVKSIPLPSVRIK